MAAVAVVMVAVDVVTAGDAPRMSAVEAAATDAGATAAEAATTGAEAAVASAFSLAAAVAVEVVAEVIGAGPTGCGPGALIMATSHRMPARQTAS